MVARVDTVLREELNRFWGGAERKGEPAAKARAVPRNVRRFIESDPPQ
jgi:hypothetical protein